MIGQSVTGFWFSYIRFVDTVIKLQPKRFSLDRIPSPLKTKNDFTKLLTTQIKSISQTTKIHFYDIIM